MKIFNYLKELYKSNIPADYWDLDLKSLKVDITYKKIIEEFVLNIDNAVLNGLGLILMGEQRGIGKTSLACEVAKSAVIKRYSVYYQIAQSIVDDKFSEDKNIIQRIKNSDMIIIDELDKVVMRENSNIPKQIENLLRELLPNKKSIVMATNMSGEEELEEKFKILSLIKRYIKIVPMTGTDYSDNLQEKWMDRLKRDKSNYFSENILRNASIFHEKTIIANEKEFDQLF